jgi:hypothetical protein
MERVGCIGEAAKKKNGNETNTFQGGGGVGKTLKSRF